jgi:ABC-type proline/glycine betaine transport system substrate-binding protein
MGVVNWKPTHRHSGMALLNSRLRSWQISAAADSLPAMDKVWTLPLLETGDDRPSQAVSGKPGGGAHATSVAAAGLKTFADIAKFKDQLGGKIYGIEPGSGANTTIKSMIETNHFGLKDFKIVESGEAGMLAAVQRAVNRKEFVVFVGWTRTR